jgi:hypothetical protein
MKKIAANRNYRLMTKGATWEEYTPLPLSVPKDLGIEITQDVKDAVAPFFIFTSSLGNEDRKRLMSALRKLLSQDLNVVNAVMEEATRMLAEASDPNQGQRISPLLPDGGV